MHMNLDFHMWISWPLPNFSTFMIDRLARFTSTTPDQDFEVQYSAPEPVRVVVNEMVWFDTVHGVIHSLMYVWKKNNPKHFGFSGCDSWLGGHGFFSSCHGRGTLWWWWSPRFPWFCCSVCRNQKISWSCWDKSNCLANVELFGLYSLIFFAHFVGKFSGQYIGHPELLRYLFFNPPRLEWLFWSIQVADCLPKANAQSRISWSTERFGVGWQKMKLFLFLLHSNCLNMSHAANHHQAMKNIWKLIATIYIFEYIELVVRRIFHPEKKVSVTPR